MTYPTGWARLAALWQRFVDYFGGKKVPAKVVSKHVVLERLAQAARSRRTGR